MAVASRGVSGPPRARHRPARSVPAPGVAATPTPHRTLVTIGVMMATTMQILDSTIANVALPHMRASLGGTADTITWVLTSYIVASAVAIPIAGWLSDRVGSRRLFLTAIVTFVLASMLCGTAVSLPEMVAFRLLQGTAAAFMNPLSQTVMMDINPPERQARALSIWSMGIMGGPILGPVLGGWLTENYNWRWVFYINVPIGIACFALLFLMLPSRPQRSRTFDGFGFSMLALGIAAFQLMLDRGETRDWFSSWEIVIEAIIAFSGMWIFLIHMFSARNPMFDKEIFRDRNLATGVAFMLISGMVTTSTLALLPSMLQNLFGYPVLNTGLLMVPRGFGVLAAMSVAGQLLQKDIDARLMVGAGLLLIIGSLYAMTGWSLDMGPWSIVTTGIVQGMGLGITFIPLNTLAFGTLDPLYRTEGTSLMNLARSMGASVGISLLTAELARNTQISHSDIAANLSNQALGADPSLLQLLGNGADTVMAIVNGEVTRQAAMIAYLDDFKLMMILCTLCVPLVFILKRPRRRKTDEDEPHMAFE